jgi:hypothetical protein
MAPSKFGYRAFGLTIHSEFPVSGFEPFEANCAEVNIREADVPNRLSQPLNKGVLFESATDEFLLHIPQVAVFYVFRGCEIHVKRQENIPYSELSAFLIGTAFGALLHQRQLLPMHACTVVFQQKCLVFAGTSGVGKSTLAAALVRKGGLLIADDITVINCKADQPSALPAFPTIKMWKDSLDHLGISTSTLTPVRNHLLKFFLPVEKQISEPVRIDCLYVLNSHNQADIQISPILGIQKFRIVKRHTYLFKSMQKTGLGMNHFLQASLLAKAVPLYLISRPVLPMDLEKLVTCISHHISKGNAP